MFSIRLLSSRVILNRVSIFLIFLHSSMFSIRLLSSRVILNRVSVFLIFLRSSIFSCSNTSLFSNSESLLNLQYANFSLIFSLSPWIAAALILLVVGLYTPYWFAILVAPPPLLRSPILSVCMGVCLRSTGSGVWILRGFSRFIRSLEANFSTTLRKIISGLPS